MKRRCASAVLFMTSLIFWLTACRRSHSTPSNQPAELAQKLYADVIAHPTSDIPSGDDWSIFAPFLSKSLLRDIDIYKACMADEDRHYAALKGPPVKLASLGESGIFSGPTKREPRAPPRSKTASHKTTAPLGSRSNLGYLNTKWNGASSTSSSKKMVASSWRMWYSLASSLSRESRTIVLQVLTNIYLRS